MTLIQRGNLWTYICSMEPVCAEKELKIVYLMLSCIFGVDHTCHNVFKGCASIEKITKLCREDKVCLNGVKTEIWWITGGLLREILSRFFPSLSLPPFLLHSTLVPFLPQSIFMLFGQRYHYTHALFKNQTKISKGK